MNHTHRSSVRAIQSSVMACLAVCCMAAGPSFSPASQAADDQETLKALLAEARDTLAGATSVEACCVVGRNAQSSRIVVRLDRIDAAVASFLKPTAEAEPMQSYGVHARLTGAPAA